MKMGESKIGWMLCGAGLVLVGAFIGARWNGPTAAEGGELASFNETLLHASSAANGENFSLATGPIDGDAEGVFVLDHATGVLKCAVLNHRTGKFAALFSTNVNKDIGAAKNPNYQMVTGQVNFVRGSAPAIRPGLSVVYVLNTANGQMVAYGIPWRREAASTGRPQLGMLQTIDGMIVRTIPVRE